LDDEPPANHRHGTRRQAVQTDLIGRARSIDRDQQVPPRSDKPVQNPTKGEGADEGDTVGPAPLAQPRASESNAATMPARTIVVSLPTMSISSTLATLRNQRLFRSHGVTGQYRSVCQSVFCAAAAFSERGNFIQQSK